MQICEDCGAVVPSVCEVTSCPECKSKNLETTPGVWSCVCSTWPYTILRCPNCGAIAPFPNEVNSVHVITGANGVGLEGNVAAVMAVSSQAYESPCYWPSD